MDNYNGGGNETRKEKEKKRIQRILQNKPKK